MFFQSSPEKSLISQVEEFRFLSCMSPFWIPFLGCSKQTRDRDVPAVPAGMGILSPQCLELLAHGDNKMRFVSLLFLNVGGVGPPPISSISITRALGHLSVMQIVRPHPDNALPSHSSSPMAGTWGRQLLPSPTVAHGGHSGLLFYTSLS